jgi:hypothetical protein
MELVVQLVSLVGALLILWAFVGLQRGKLSNKAPVYQWANFFGAALLTLVAIFDARVGFVMLEGAWAGVSLWSIVAPSREG